MSQPPIGLYFVSGQKATVRQVPFNQAFIDACAEARRTSDWRYANGLLESHRDLKRHGGDQHQRDQARRYRLKDPRLVKNWEWNKFQIERAMLRNFEGSPPAASVAPNFVSQVPVAPSPQFSLFAAQ